MLFNKNQFKKLANVLTFDNPCISIYIPTHRTGNGQEDKIRFKNAVSDALNQLVEGKMLLSKTFNEPEAHRFLSKAEALLDEDEFWSHLSDGLAIFIGKDIFEYYLLPVHFESTVYVANDFYLRPMMPLLNGKDRFFLLALSQNEVRFFEGHQYHITPIIIDDLVPDNMEAVMVEKESVLQAHSGGSSSDSFIFHGHGAGKDHKTKDLEKYFRQIDKGLMKMLHDENAPLIIATVDYLMPLYKNISNYYNIMDFHINGNPEQDDPVLLHEKAWAFLQDFFQSDALDKKESFSQYMAEDKASFSVHDIVPAAINGRVDTVFIDAKAPIRWGFYKLTNNNINYHNTQKEYSTCLLNLAAVQTFLNGGTVYHVERPEFPQATSEINAIYRY